MAKVPEFAGFTRTFVRGSEHRFKFIFKTAAEPNGANVSNWTGIRIVGRLRVSDAAPTFTMTVGAGITAINATVGEFGAKVPPSATSGLQNRQTEVLVDIEGTNPDGNVEVPDGGQGKFIVMPEVALPS